MTSDSYAYETYSKINDTFTSNDPEDYGAKYVTSSDHGTSHTSIISDSGVSVSVTSSVNLYFGSRFMSPKTGVILNDDMDDFAYPNIVNSFGVQPSPNNFVKPYKMPVSSMSPTIVVDTLTNSPRLVLGGAGGTKITTATAAALVHIIWMGLDVKQAVDQPRVHHQLSPMEVRHEELVSLDILSYLDQVGHNLTETDFMASLNGVEVDPNDERIYANADYRGSGGIDGF